MAKLAEKYNTDVRTYEHPESGDYKLKLKEIENCILEYQGKTSEKLRWKFETVGSKENNILDSQNKPFVVSYTTGLTYTGSEKANLTKLMKGFYGRKLSLVEFSDLEEKDLIGKEVGAVIEIQEKESGEYPSILLFKTIKKKVVPAPIQEVKKAIAEVKPVSKTSSYVKYAEEAGEEEYLEEEDIREEDIPFK